MPDSGLTALLMRDGLSNRLRAQFERFRPTHVALPTLRDRHPDHSAVHVGARLALPADAPPKLLAYAIHGEAERRHDMVVRLGARARDDKRAAILRHETQMRLSRGRFLRFAADVENFDSPALQQREDHPLQATLTEAEVIVRIARAHLRDASDALRILAVIETASGERVRMVLPLGEVGAVVAVQGDPLPPGLPAPRWETDQGELVLRLPLVADVGKAFFKLDRRRAGLVIYDRYGWQLGEGRSAQLGKV